MATEKKNDKERSVEERLQSLFQLQTYLSEIDRIKILRGELPNEVKDLEDEIIRYQTRIQKHKDEIEELKAFVVRKKDEIIERKDKIARYDDQINNVRNNREFAFLEKEKEFEGLEIELAEKNIREALEKQQQKTADIARAEEELADNEHILVEKRKELEDIVNGLGIVTVQRNACGGCFNRIPPQRQLEIKMHKKVIVCEYCGRIMVDGALVGIEQPVVEAPAKPKRKLKSSL